MDNAKICELLRATIDPNQRLQAEEQLTQVHKIIGFLPNLLQVVMQNDVDSPVRQAGAIYLKNLVTSSWQDREAEPGVPLPFSIHEQDRAMIRDTIVEAIVHAPDIIRVQLCVCINNIIKNDFPGRWTQVVDKISIYLQNRDVNGWNGALLCMYQLVKNYEYKKSAERAPLTEAMNLLLPQMYNLMMNLINDPSEQSVLMQKLILKIFYALTQYALPLEVITKEIFSNWMEICRQILDRPAPDSSHIDEEERPEMPWWKAKKWAAHIVLRMFERYGSPGNVVSKEYNEFAEWFLQTFTNGLLNVLLKILDQYRNKIYVSPRVMTDTLNYIKHAVSHAHSWKMLKPHFIAIIQDVIFPLMSYSEADEELWEADPIEYIRQKFDVFDDYTTPVPAAETLLHNCCKTRKGVLPQVMQIIMQIINAPNLNAKQKDGALHMVGSLADVLLKKKVFKDQVENLILQYVFPEFASPHGHLRARACWVLHYFSEIKLKNQHVLAEIMRLTSHALLNDKELPVKVEAAVALQMFLISHDNSASKYLEGQIKEITMELLKIIRETENEDLTNVLQKIVCIYADQLLPIAVDICQHLATTFSQVLEADENSDERAITAMGLLNTMETLLSVMEEHPQVMLTLHPIVLQVVGHVLQQNVNEFYEEAFSLVYDLTSKSISPDMWKLLEIIYQLFQKDGIDYFVDMMPALHNYITVDTPAFLSNQNHVLAMFNMCKTILTGNTTEEAECSAAKLLEVIILQCKGQIDECIPSFVELALTRLTREVKTSELRTMCLQVVIAGLYYNPQLLLQVLEKIPLPASNESIASHFIKQWIHDSDCFLGIHDRKLCVIGLCTLMTLGEGKPQVLSELGDKIIPTLILIFDGLKRAYAARAAECEEEESEDEDDDLEDGISSDEDEVDEMAYFDRLAKIAQDKAAEQGFELTATIKDGVDSDDDDDDDDEDDSGDEMDETALEGFVTPLDDEDNPAYVDEYIVFQEVMTNLPNVDPNWYNMLTRNLKPEEAKSLQEILVLAEQKKAAKRSKDIENSGGYQFTQHQIPSSFNFTGQQ